MERRGLRQRTGGAGGSRQRARSGGKRAAHRLESLEGRPLVGTLLTSTTGVVSLIDPASAWAFRGGDEALAAHLAGERRATSGTIAAAADPSSWPGFDRPSRAGEVGSPLPLGALSILDGAARLAAPPAGDAYTPSASDDGPAFFPSSTKLAAAGPGADGAAGTPRGAAPAPILADAGNSSRPVVSNQGVGGAASNGDFPYSGLGGPASASGSKGTNLSPAGKGRGAFSPSTTSRGRVSLGFENGLDGWRTFVDGGTEAGKGSVTAGSAILREGDSFVVGLDRTFIVPDVDGPLIFRYTDLDFDRSDLDSMNDAFEASIVDAAGHTLVPAIGADRDAFYNVTEEFAPATGSGASVTGLDQAIQTVTVDLSGLTPGTPATIRFRLVNNDQDDLSSVRILDVSIPGEAAEGPAVGPIADVTGLEGAPVAISTTFTNAEALSHTAVVDWGDGVTTPADLTPAAGGGTVRASHVYADDGAYQAVLVVTDAQGRTARAPFLASIGNVAPAATAGVTFEVVTGASGPALDVVIEGRFSDPGFGRTSAGTSETFTATVDWGGGVVQVAAVDVAAGSEGVETTGRFTVRRSFATPPGILTPRVRVADDDGGADEETLKFAVARLDVAREIDLVVGGSVPVLVGRDPNFDATRIDASSVRFASASARPAANLIQVRPNDVRMNFRAADTGVRQVDQWALLTGRLVDGTPFAAVDGIAVVGGSTAPAEVGSGPAKFFVVDPAADDVFRYDAAGAASGSFDVDRPSSNATGVTGTATGDRVWTIDATTHSVSAQGPNGALLGAWRALGLTSPQGIALEGRDHWVVDSGLKALVRYAGTSALTSGASLPSAVLPLAPANASPTGLATDGRVLWVTDDAADAVFVYDLEGTLLGRWSLDARNSDASGLTTDQAGGTSLWVVDRADRAVYRYDGATGLRSGGATATSLFALAAGNVAPEDVFDPPPVLTLAEPVDNSTAVAGSPILVSGSALDGAAPAATVTVDGKPADVVDAAGNYFHRLVVAPGTDSIEVKARAADGSESSRTTRVKGMSSSSAGIDFSKLVDLTGSLAAEYGRTSFVDATNRLYAELSLRNLAADVLRGTLLVGVTNISDPTVALLGADGVTPSGIPYIELKDLLPGGVLGQDEATDPTTLAFHAPNRERFTYDLVIFGVPNRAPTIVTVPDVEALAGRAYSYDVDATDLDGDALTYRLVAGPMGLAVDPASGRIAWSPGAAEIGNHSVIVEVDDGRGGFDRQAYVLSVITPPPNRPPFFISTPEVDAVVGTPYSYPALARDPDDDVLRYRVLAGPAGLSVDAATGLVSWTPTAAGTYSVSLSALDDRGGEAVQNYSIRVAADPLNGPPVIISEPTTTHHLPGASNPPRGDVDPESLDLDLDIDERALQTVSITLPQGGAEGFADVVFVVDESGSMSGEHEWLEDMVIELDAALQARGIGPNRFFLVGFGGSGDRLGGHFFNLLTNAGITVHGPDGTVLTTQNIPAVLGSSLATTQVLTSGAQVVEIFKTDAVAGDYGFYYELSTPSVTTAPLAFGSTISDRLDGPKDFDRYTFRLDQARLAYFDSLTSNAALSWTLQGPSGVVATRAFAQSDGNNFTSNPILDLPAGDYVLTVTATGFATGDYAFRLLDLSAATPVSPGTPFSGTLSPASETDAYRFNAVAGDRFYFDSVSTTGPAPTWRLIDPFGRQVGSLQSSDLATATLPYSGVYTFLVEGSVTSTGTTSYTYNVVPVASSPPVPLTVGATTSGAIATPGEVDLYTFSVASPGLFYLDSLSNLPNLRFTLTGPSGVVSSNRSFVEDLTTVYNPLRLLAGDYVLSIAADGDSTPGYSFRVADLAAATPMTPGVQVVGTLSPSNETDAYKFTAAAGDQFRFAVDGSVGTVNQWRLIDPFGAVVFSGGFATVATASIPRSGVYTLLVENAASSTSSATYRFTAQFLGNVPPPPAPTGTPLTLGATTSGAISAVGEVDAFAFDLAQPTVVAFDGLTNNTNLRWSLTGPAGAVVTGLAHSFDTTTAPIRLIPGSYVLTVFAVNDATLAYSFRLNDLGASTPLTPGTPVSGTLSPANETDAYRFNAAAGDRFYLDVVTSTGTFSKWRLVDPFGNVVMDQAFADDVNRTIPRTGTYTLLIDGAITGTGTPAYTINVIPIAPAASTPMALGSTVTGSISTPGQSFDYTFGVATRTIVSFDALTSNSSLRWSLAGPSGAVASSLTLTSDTTTAPLRLVPGSYTLTVFAAADAPGAYSFRLNDLAASTPLTPGTPVSGTLSPANETDAYRFNAAAGDRFFFDAVTSTGTIAKWRLVDPYGVVVFDSSFGDQGIRTLASTGSYSLLVDGAISATGTPTYTLNVVPVVEAPATALSLGATVSGSVATAGQTVAYSFNVGATNLAAFDALTNSTNLRWTLVGPAGAVASNVVFSNDVTTNPLRLLPGSYTLTVFGSGDAAGAYSFRLNDLATATPLTPGTPASGSLSPANETDAYKFNAVAGDRFFFNVVTSAGSFAKWRLVDPVGAIVFDSSFSDAGIRTLTRTGPYTLLIDGAVTGTGTPTYTVDVVPVVDAPAAPLALGATTSGSVASAGQTISYGFNLAGPTVVAFDALTNSTNLRWTLVGPFGVAASSVTFSNDTTAAPMYLRAGSYTLTVFGAADAVGAYSFRLNDLKASTPLTPGTPVSGTLSPATETDAYRFNAVAGDRFFFNVVTSAGSFAKWRLVDPSGSLVFDSGFSDAGLRVLPRTGTYALLIDGAINATGTPTYTIDVNPVVDAAQIPMTLGETVVGGLGSAGQWVDYSFDVAGRRLVAFDALTNNGNLRWSLAGPSGTVASSLSFVNDVSTAPFVLIPGSYTLRVFAAADAVGAYSFRLNDLAASTPLTPGTPVSGTLSPANETDAYRFNAAAGERFFFDVVSSAGSFGRLRLVDPFGVEVFDSGFADVAAQTLALTGAYTLLVDGLISGTGTPTYTVNVAPVADGPATPLTLGATVAGSVATAGRSINYAFNVAAPTLVFFDSLTNSTNLRWTLVGPSGAVASNVTFSNDTAAAAMRLIPGAYTLQVFGNGDATGTYSFRLLDTPSMAPMTPGTPFSGTLSPANATVGYRLDAQAGDRFIFDVVTSTGTGAARMRLFDAYGAQVFARTFGDVPVTTLPRAGTYTLLVEGGITATGTPTYTINAIFDGNTPPPSVPTTPLTLGDVVSGAVSVGGEVDAYSFTAPADGVYYFDSLTNSSTIRLTLEGPSGAVVSNQAFNGDAGTAFNPIRLVAGEYRLSVFGSTATTTGSYGFRLSPLAGAANLTPGTPTGATTLSPANETKIYRFAAAAGARYYFDVVSSTGFSGVWRLVDPYGNVVFNSNFVDVATTTIPRTGTYTLLVEGASGATGTPTFNVNVVPVVDAPATPLPLGAIVEGSIATPAEADVYAFSVASPILGYFDGLSSDANLRWTLAGPGGAILSNITFANDRTTAPVYLPAGDYTLTITSVNDTTPPYSFRYLDLAAALPITPGTPTGATPLSPPNSTAAYRFSAIAGERYFFDVVAATSFSGNWRLVDPFGNVVFNSSLADVATTTIPRTGLYTLLVEAPATATGTPSFNVNVVPAATSTAILPIGAVVTADLTTPGAVRTYTFDLAADGLYYLDSLTNSTALRLTLDGPAGTPISNRGFNEDAGTAFNPLRLVAGSYTLTVFGNGDAAGAATFRLLDLAAGAPLTPGTPTGVTPLTPPNSTTAYRFSGSAGERFFFDVVAAAGFSGNWRLLDPTGATVFSNSLADATAVLPLDGSYTLLVEGAAAATGTPTYNINAVRLALPSAPLALGAVTQGTLAAGDEARFGFDAPAGRQVFFDGLAGLATIRARIVGPAGNTIVDLASTANSGVITLPEAGRYELVIDGTNDASGAYRFRLLDVAAQPTVAPGVRVIQSLDPAQESDLYLVQAEAGQVLVIKPGDNMIAGSAAQVSAASKQLEVNGGTEDGYDGLEVGLTHGSFRAGAAINAVLITDEDRDVVDPNLNFTNVLAMLLNQRAMLNSVNDATFRAAGSNNVLGVDARGNAYIADGAGGYTVATGGAVVSASENTKADYIDLAWAVDGAAWDLNKLRVGGLTAASFTKAFVDIKSTEIEQQLEIEVVASDPSVRFENRTGVLSGLRGGDTATFDVAITGDGRARSFDLLFVRPGTSIVLGSIPVTLNDDYVYQVEAVDPDLDPITYRIESGPAGATIDSTTGLLTWDPAGAGVYTFVVSASDGRGGVDRQEFRVTVDYGLPNASPTITSTAPTSATIGLPFAYAVRATDPDGDSLTYYLEGAPAGMSIDRRTGEVSWTPGSLGSATFTVAVLDGRGGEARQAVTLAVGPDAGNVAPTITSTGPVAARIGAEYRYDVVATDPNGDRLAFDLPVKPDGMAIDADGRIVWTPRADQVGEANVVVRVSDGRGGIALEQVVINVAPLNTTPAIMSTPPTAAQVGVAFGHTVRAQDADGDPLTYGLAVAPAGMTIDPATGVISWTPTAAQAGTTFDVQAVATDGRGGRASQSFRVAVAAAAPNGQPQIVSTPRTRVGLGAEYRYQVDAIDPDSDRLRFVLVAGPAGMAVDAARGLVTWPTSGAALGSHSVEVRVEDGRGGAAVQRFSVLVVPSAVNGLPTIVSTPPASATLGRAFAYNPTATDPDGDPLIWTLEAGPAGMSIDGRTGSVRWTPAEAQVGTASIRLRVDDGQGGFATQAFDVRVRGLNAPPTILSAPPTTANVGALSLYAVRAEAPEGDALTFSLTTAPAGMTIDAATGLIRWAPTAGQVGTRSVVVQVDDGQGGRASQAYDVLVSAAAPNEGPVITSTPEFSATAGVAYRYPVVATDADGDALQYRLLTGPAGMAVDPTTGVASWTPAAGQIGVHPVSIAAFDPAGAGAVQSFNLRVLAANRLPTISSTPATTVTAGASYRYTVRASDPDGEPLIFALTTAPAGMTIDAAGRIAWDTTAADVGSKPVVVQVRDPRGGTATQPFTLVVSADATSPTIAVQAQPTPANVGEPVSILVRASDDVAVVDLRATLDGVNLPLDASGRATFVPPRPGVFVVQARATDAAGNVGVGRFDVVVRDPNDGVAPVVALADSLEGMDFTAPTDIVGRAQDANLAGYTLSLVDDGGATIAVVARGSTSVDGVVGRLDTTMLPNGGYSLVLSATDLGGNSATVSRSITISGALKMGDFRVSFIDLTVPVSGVPITVTRTYDSLTAGSADDLGHGWRLEYRNTDLDASVPRTGMEEYGVYTPFRSGSKVYVTLPGGERAGFTFRPTPAPGLAGSFLGIQRPNFIPDPGVKAKLTVPSADLLRTPDGDYYMFLSSIAYNPMNDMVNDVFTLTTRDGLSYDISPTDGKMQRVVDRNGVTLSFSDRGILSSTGVGVQFERDPQGRITAVVDPMGRRIRYGYDGGDLTSVVDRDNNTTRFKYEEPGRPHFLTEIIDPLGRSGVRNDYDDQGRLIRVYDASGDPVTLAYNVAGRTSTVADPLGNVRTVQYDERGNVTTEIDPEGGIIRRTFDGQNDLLEETDPLGKTTRYAYDPEGNELRKTDPLGQVTVTTYQTLRARGNVSYSLPKTVVAPVGNVQASGYDSVGNLLTQTRPDGTMLTLAYGSGNGPTRVSDSLGARWQFAYDTAGRVTRQVDGQGNAVAFTYNANGDKLTETRTQTTPAGVRTLTTTYTYDNSGRVTSVQDPAGNVARTEYDAAGQKVAEVDALGRRTTYVYNLDGRLVETILPDLTPSNPSDPLLRRTTEYDAAGRAIAEVDEQGRRTTHAYDKAGRRTSTSFPDATPADPADAPTARTEYDAAGRVTAEVDELGRRTTYTYDALGMLLTVRDPLSNVTTMTRDAAGRIVAQTDTLGRTTRYTLDPTGRVVETLYADGSRTRKTYDVRGRVATSVDELNRTTRYEHDGADRLTAVVDPLGQRTEYAYDEVGGLILQRDAEGRVSRYEYDALGRRTAVVLPLGQRSSTAYDAVGNVVRTTDFDGSEVASEYDAWDRLTAHRLPGGLSETFAYTAAGALAATSTSAGVTTFTYDARDRLASRAEPDGRTITYTYDAAGNRTSTVAPSGTIAYTYDAMDRISTVTDPDGGLTRYTYDAVGSLTRTERPNGVVETRGYDARNRLTLVRDAAPGGILSESAYTLAANGRRDSVRDESGRVTTYSYDALDRVLEELASDPVRGPRRIAYTYDRVGNRLTRTDSAEGLVSYAYDANDRLATETAGSAVTRYTYDGDGNVLSKTSAVDRVLYQWDAKGRLASVDLDGDGTADVVNRYDAEDRRVAQVVEGVETRFLLDGVPEHFQVVEEYTPGGVLVASFVHGNDLISQERGTTRSFHLVDGVGSTKALTNSAGAVTDRYLYDASGRILARTGTTANDHLFAGERRDAATGLDFLRARYYDPSTGRFTSRDPVEGVLPLPLTRSPYIYGLSNPVNNVDPSGRFFASLGVSVSLINTALPTIVFGAIRIGVTAMVARGLEPAFEAREAALLEIADGDPTGLAFDNYVSASEAIAFGFRMLSLGFDAIGLAEAATSVGKGMLSLSKSYSAISTTVRIPGPIASAAQQAGTTLWKVSASPVSAITSAGIPQLIINNTQVVTKGWAVFWAHFARNLYSTKKFLDSLDKFGG